MTGFDEAIAALTAELGHWPGHHLSSITAGSSSSSHARDGSWHSDRGWYRQTHDSWCATVKQDGWDKETSRYFVWGKTIPAAIEKLAEELTSRRTNPHLHHILDCDFADGCEQCADEKRRIADGTL